MRALMVTSGRGRLSAQAPRLIKQLSDPRLSLADIERLAREAPDVTVRAKPSSMRWPASSQKS